MGSSVIISPLLRHAHTSRDIGETFIYVGIIMTGIYMFLNQWLIYVPRLPYIVIWGWTHPRRSAQNRGADVEVVIREVKKYMEHFVPKGECSPQIKG